MIWLAVFALAWDGDFLYVARAGGVDVYRDGRKLRALGDEVRRVTCLAAHKGRLAEGGGQAGERGQVRLWESGKLLKRIDVHADLVYALAWSADGSTIYSASGDTTIGVIDVASGAVKGKLEGHTGAVLALATSGARLVSGGADGTMRVWEEGKLVRVISNHTAALNALAFAADGETLASGSADRTVRVWKIGQGRLTKIIRGHEAAVTDLAWDGEKLWSACADGKGRRLDVDAATIVEVVETGADWLHAVQVAGGRVHFAPAAGELFSK